MKEKEIAQNKLQKVTKVKTEKKIVKADRVKKSAQGRSKTTKARVKLEEQLVLQPLRGMRDILPGDQPYWQQVRNILEQVATECGFGRIDTPVLEFERLFLRSIGNTTEVAQKEMYSFVTRGDDRVALRPEHTAGTVRAYIQHGMNVLPKPVKLFSIGSVYRYDRPQEGRYREFFQGNFDIYGEMDPILDAQVVQMAARVLSVLGISDFVFRVNSVGTSATRVSHKRALTRYFTKYKKEIAIQLHEFISPSPFRILDAKEGVSTEILQNAPKAINYLDEESQEHFNKFKEYLDELEIPYEHDQNLVRGLDYYTRTVFEIVVRNPESGRQYSLGGGGRYDNLIESLGGEQTPAIGFGLGLDRLVLEMKRLKAQAYQAPKPRVFLVQLGDLAKKKSLKIFEKLQKAGILTAESFGRGNLTAQLRKASRAGVDITIILGQKEALDETVIIKTMISGTQEVIPQDKLVSVLRKALKESVVVKKLSNK